MRAKTKGKHEMGSRSRRQKEGSYSMRLKIAIAGMAATSLLAIPSAASALAPVSESFSFSESGTIKCSGFKDQFTDYYDGTEVTYFDSAGNPIRVVISAEHHSDDTNSVTGLTVHEHGHFTITSDLLTGTETITGNQEIANRPGTGIVVQDVGRVVYDSHGDLVFFAGGRKHSEIFLGDQVLCDALA